MGDERNERLHRHGDDDDAPEQPPPNDDVDGDAMGEPDDDVREAFGERHEGDDTEGDDTEG